MSLNVRYILRAKNKITIAFRFVMSMLLIWLVFFIVRKKISLSFQQTVFLIRRRFELLAIMLNNRAVRGNWRKHRVDYMVRLFVFSEDVEISHQFFRSKNGCRVENWTHATRTNCIEFGFHIFLRIPLQNRWLHAT